MSTTITVSAEGSLYQLGGGVWQNSSPAAGGAGTVNGPIPMPADAAPIRSVSTGGESFAAVDAKGALYTWGKGQPVAPTKLAALSERVVKTVSCGKDHMAITTVCGELWTLGSNACGKLGQGPGGSTRGEQVVELQRYYARYNQTKTAGQAAAIIDTRRGKRPCLDPGQWLHLSDELNKKYGQPLYRNPFHFGGKPQAGLVGGFPPNTKVVDATWGKGTLSRCLTRAPCSRLGTACMAVSGSAETAPSSKMTCPMLGPLLQLSIPRWTQRKTCGWPTAGGPRTVNTTASVHRSARQGFTDYWQSRVAKAIVCRPAARAVRNGLCSVYEPHYHYPNHQRDAYDDASLPTRSASQC